VPQAYYHTVHEVPALRDGSLRLLDVFRLGPVLTFPSFHAVYAILFIWSTWPVRWLRPFALLLNGTMLVSTPVGGGHYFIDVTTGMVIAGLSIYTATRITSALKRWSLGPKKSESRSLLPSVAVRTPSWPTKN
jgi:membrane-associated phospholipid phosphatase